jgi:hypothetical protein
MKFLKPRKGKTGRSGRTTSRKAKAAPQWDQQRAYRAFRIGSTLALLIAVGLGITFGRQWISQRVGESTAASLETPAAEIVFQNIPRWMNGEPAAELTRQITDHWTANPLDDQSLRSVVDALQASAWIERVIRVQRTSPTGLEIVADYRVPVAVVADARGFYLVDHVGRRLPGIYQYHELKPLGLIPLTGVAAAAPQAGDVWPGGDVQAGLSLAMLVGDQPWVQQVRAIDVTNFQNRADRRRPQLLMLTDEGAVRWGRAPGQEGVIEPRADRKLAMLNRVAETYRGPIDAGGRIVDVFTDAPQVHASASVN